MPQIKIAIVAALEREIWPLIQYWRVEHRTYDGRAFKFFEHDGKVATCSGIGAEAGRRATEAIIRLYQPNRLISAGFAGALDPKFKVGNILVPAFVIDANDGSRFATESGTGAIVSSPTIAGAVQKAKLAKAYAAVAVDMEGASVGRGAQTHGIPFMAVKSISDELGFELPPMQNFVDPAGQFRFVAFTGFLAIRPWLWGRTITLYKNCATASKALSQWIEDEILQKLENPELESHPIKAPVRIPS